MKNSARYRKPLQRSSDVKKSRKNSAKFKPKPLQLSNSDRSRQGSLTSPAKNRSMRVRDKSLRGWLRWRESGNRMSRLLMSPAKSKRMRGRDKKMRLDLLRSSNKSKSGTDLLKLRDMKLNSLLKDIGSRRN